MSKVNLDLAGTNSDNDIADELKNTVGASAFALDHDRFFGSTDLRIWTGAGETGTQLIQDTDYTLGGLDSDLTAESIAQIWSTVLIDNVTYQTGNLYFTYHAVADEIDALDRYTIVLPSGTDFTVEGAGDTSIKISDSTASEYTQLTQKGSDGDFEISRLGTGGIDIAIQPDGDIIFAPVSGGNIGLGISIPLGLLHIKSATGSNGALIIDTTDSDDATSDAVLQFREAGTSKWYIGNDGSDSDIFKIGITGFASTIVWMTPDGDVGIGQSPSYRLSVYDDLSGYVARFTNDGNNANRYGILISAGADDGSGTTYFLTALDGDGNATGRLQTVGGTFALADVSDEAVKQNIKDTAKAGVDIISQIKVRDFQFIKVPDVTHTGFVAQELEGIVPEAITQDTDGLRMTTRSTLIPYLVKAVQELKVENDAMDIRLKQLEEAV